MGAGDGFSGQRLVEQRSFALGFVYDDACHVASRLITRRTAHRGVFVDSVDRYAVARYEKNQLKKEQTS
jgi:predicted N-formylglutamate amidohydrolase